MKTALIFPGQGSQYVGMGRDFYDKYQTSREIFLKLDHLLNRDISGLIFSGDKDELSQTQNSQPAIMATSIAILNTLISEDLISNNSFQAVAGHSLGEYSALVANKSLTFEESAALLEVRSKAMQECMPLGTGGMIAIIGSKNNNIKNLIENPSIKGRVYIANDNADGQIVLSGEIDAINYIVNNSKELEIKRAIKLSVSAPFHCELMRNASEIMGTELKKYKFRKFNVPLFSNVTSNKCNAEEISRLLELQVISKVRWREIIENMINDGFESFIEIGPGNVLTNLVRRISKNVNTYSISTISDIEKFKNL